MFQKGEKLQMTGYTVLIPPPPPPSPRIDYCIRINHCVVYQFDITVKLRYGYLDSDSMIFKTLALLAVYLSI